MQNLNLSKEAIDFLIDFALQIEIQDNRATANPYYYQVRCIKELPAPKDYTDENVYFVYQDNETWNEKDLKEWCQKEGNDFDGFVSEHCEVYSKQEVNEDENIFFTKKDYDQHMELNGHNYRYYKKAYSYIKYANRNPEIKMLLETILEIAKQLKEEKSFWVPITDETKFEYDKYYLFGQKNNGNWIFDKFHISYSRKDNDILINSCYIKKFIEIAGWTHYAPTMKF